MENTITADNIDFIGVGSPKCGTTWIYRALEEHPDVCMGRPKEIHFFNKDHGFESSETAWRYEEGVDSYLAHFAHCSVGPNTKVGEFSPKYIYDAQTPALIKKHCPNAKLIISLRDPVERTYSHYHHVMSKSPGYFENFSQAISTEPELVQKSKYSTYLKQYFDVFDNDQILVVFMEDLKKDAAAFIKNIYTFIGVDDTFIPPSVDIKINAREERYSQRNKQIKRHIFRTYNLLRRIPGMGFVFRLLKRKGLHAKTLSSLNKTTVKKQARDNTAPAEVRELLAPMFADDIAATEALLGCRIDAWHT